MLVKLPKLVSRSAQYYNSLPLRSDRNQTTKMTKYFGPNISEFTQQDGRKKRTAKQLCVTNVTRLLPVGFVVIFT